MKRVLSKITIKGRKKAQMEISFGFIFAIIVIAAIIAVAVYVIIHFLNLSKCSQTGLFYSDLQGEIDKAWAGSMTSKQFSGTLPSNLKSVCFGSLKSNPISDFIAEQNELKKFQNLDKNVFLYPNTKACSAQLSNYKLEHIKVDRFFCVPVSSGKVSIKISKNETDALVTLTR